MVHILGVIHFITHMIHNSIPILPIIPNMNSGLIFICWFLNSNRESNDSKSESRTNFGMIGIKIKSFFRRGIIEFKNVKCRNYWKLKKLSPGFMLGIIGSRNRNWFRNHKIDDSKYMVWYGFTDLINEGKYFVQKNLLPNSIMANL